VHNHAWPPRAAAAAAAATATAARPTPRLTLTRQTFLFPHTTRARPQVSGGGYRATTLALGWVRALHALGVMDAARYLSSNSGGSWFNGAYSYSQV
jgi:hypothetical protein